MHDKNSVGEPHIHTQQLIRLNVNTGSFECMVNA